MVEGEYSPYYSALKCLDNLWTLWAGLHQESYRDSCVICVEIHTNLGEVKYLKRPSGGVNIIFTWQHLDFTSYHEMLKHVVIVENRFFFSSVVGISMN